MNIINYIYNKGKTIYKRNISEGSTYSNVERENLINDRQLEFNRSNSSSSLASSEILQNNIRISQRKKKKKKKKILKKELLPNIRFEKGFESGKIDIITNLKLQLSGKREDNKRTMVVSAHEDSISKKKDSNKLNKGRVSIYDQGNAYGTQQDKQEESSNGYKVDTLSYDRKIYRNRCDGVCVMNDNIYIFDKIKKSIYLYTPCNNVWHVFLDIYEEVTTKKYHKVVKIQEYSPYHKKEESQKKESYNYLNNISFTNYTDMVYLKHCLFIISSNAQFMNMCKVNIDNMNTIFHIIQVDVPTKGKCTFEETWNQLNKRTANNNSNNNNNNNSYENGSSELEEEQTEEEIYECPGIIENDLKNNVEKSKNRKIGNSINKEMEDCEEYKNGVSEINEFIQDTEENTNRFVKKKRKKKKKKKNIIKPRDLFSICSVQEDNYSLLYLFGGKGNSVKQENEYVDNIYNDLYMYDFYTNTWMEMYMYKSKEGEEENDMYNISSSSNETSYILKNANKNQSFIDEAKKSPVKLLSSAYHFETRNIISSNETKPSRECSTLKLNETNDVISLSHSYEHSLSEEMDLIKFVSTEDQKHIEVDVKEDSDMHMTDRGMQSSHVNIFSSKKSLKNSLDNTVEYNNSNKDSIWKNDEISKGYFKLRDDLIESLCTNCMNNRNCKYICTLVKNNISIRKIKWLHKRAGHSCIYYKNNLYIFGGISYYSFNSNKINLTCCNNLYLYNIESNKCFEIMAKGNIPEKRYRHGCVLIDHQMFVIGGETKNSTLPKNDIFVYNFSNSVWTEIVFNSKINFHSLYKTVWLENFGSIYMFGSSIVRLTKKDFKYTPIYKNDKRLSENKYLK